MNSIQSLGATLIVFAATNEYAGAQLPRPTDQVIDGTYTVVSGEKDGKMLTADHYVGSVVKISGGKIVGTDKDRKEFFACTYTIDTSKSPTPIKMKATAPKEMEASGLIKNESGVVTIIYSLPGAPEPTEFKTKENQHLFVLKPAKP